MTSDLIVKKVKQKGSFLVPRKGCSSNRGHHIVCSYIKVFLLNCFIIIVIVEKRFNGDLMELCCFYCILGFWQLYAFVKLTNRCMAQFL